MKKLFCLLLMCFSSIAAAIPVNVNGVIWDPTVGSDFSSVASIYENNITELNNRVTGYGRITEINGTNSSEFCPACELTYVVDYLVSLTSASTFIVTDLIVSFYVDDAPDFTANAPRLAQASDGDLWLQLYDRANSVSGSGGNLLLPTAYGNGNGFLDVVAGGGSAFAYFDTNAMVGGADLEMSSSFHKNVNAKEPGYDLAGSIFLNGDTRNIPEPGTVFLFGMGLLFMYNFRKLA